MQKVLNAPVRFWQLLVVVVLVTVLTSTLVVSAAPLASGFLPTGTFQMAVAKNNSGLNIPSGYTNVAVVSNTITVPVGKTADLAVLAEVDIEGGGSASIAYCFGQIRMGDINTGKKFQPGNYILYGMNPPPNNLSLPINGYLTGVTAGTHKISLVMEAGYQDCYINYSSMIILANIH